MGPGCRLASPSPSFPPPPRQCLSGADGGPDSGLRRDGHANMLNEAVVPLGARRVWQLLALSTVGAVTWHKAGDVRAQGLGLAGESSPY